MKRIGQIFEDCRRACHRTGVQLASTRSLRYPCNKERFHHVVYVGQSIAITKNLMIRYPVRETDPPVSYDLEEIQDKGENTAHAVEYFGIPANRVVIIGDSGGDGPHFEWGRKHNAFLIGSMAKLSLVAQKEKY